MWTRRPKSWIATVALGGFALPNIWTRTLTVTAISVVVTVLYERVPELHFSLTVAPFTLVGLALGVFLGFRNNTAYDRFWEGRKLWGALVNTSRTLTRQVLTLIEPPDGTPPPEALVAEEKAMVHLLIGYVHALRHHLRDEDPSATLRELLPDAELGVTEEDNVPLAILHRIAERLRDVRHRGWVHPMHVPLLDGSLTALTDIQGACERIKATPIPYSYTVLIHRIVGVYCGLLPLGLMDSLGWETPFVVLAISYAFFGLDAVGDELEQPFGLDTNDLPLFAIARTIERNLRQRLGEPMPPAAEPVRGVLS